MTPINETSIFASISKVANEIKPLIKDKDNPFTKSKYASLNSLLDIVKPVLFDNKLVLTQPIENGCVVSRITRIDTGTSLTSTLKLPDIADPQKIGSAITYYRRYTLQSLLGIQAEDDDGQTAHNQATRKKRLSESQFKKLLMPENFMYVESALHKYDMKDDYRKELEKLIDESYDNLK